MIRMFLSNYTIWIVIKRSFPKKRVEQRFKLASPIYKMILTRKTNAEYNEKYWKKNKDEHRTADAECKE